MKVPAFAEDGHYRCPRVQQSLDVGVVLCPGSRSPGGSKGRDLGLLQGFCLYPLKIFQILGIGTRPTPFNIMNPQFIQLFGDLQLILYGQADPFTLSPIPQCCIVQIY